jgi:hypothetical protein
MWPSRLEVTIIIVLFRAKLHPNLFSSYLINSPHFSPEQEESMFLRNDGVYLPVYTASQLGTSSSSLLT